MPREIVFKRNFRHAYDALSEENKRQVDESLKDFGHYLSTQKAPVGLGLKRLGEGVYEFRAGLSLRAVYVLGKSEVVLALLGTHDDVRRYLKRQ